LAVALLAKKSTPRVAAPIVQIFQLVRFVGSIVISSIVRFAKSFVWRGVPGSFGGVPFRRGIWTNCCRESSRDRIKAV
jgi:hypothetical protein